MTKKDLITLVERIVINKLTKSKLVRKMIAESVKQEVKKLLVEVETKVELSGRNILRDANQPMNLQNVITDIDRQDEPAPQTAEEIEFTKNPVYNKMIARTLRDIKSGQATLPSSEDPSNAQQVLKEEYSDVGGGFTSGGAQSFNTMRDTPASPVDTMKANRMMPDVDSEGRPLGVNANQVPDHLQKALSKNYRKFMKTVDEKIDNRLP